MNPSFDVIVIGAGLAGIAATQRLTAAGKRVALVEARSRFGGRVWTTRHPPLTHAIELGPEWFTSSGPIHHLLEGDGTATPEADGHFLRRMNGALRGMDEIGDEWSALGRRLDTIGGRDRTLAAALAECAADPALDSAAVMLRGYVEGFNAADSDAVSLHWLRQVERNQGPQDAGLRAPAGLDHAVDATLAAIGPSCTVFLETVVCAVRWRKGGVQVDCESAHARGTLAAAAVVVTLPLSILQLPPDAPGAVRFAPSLASKRRALGQLALGPVIKLNLIFDAPFWRDLPQMRDALFVQDISQPIPTWWTTNPVDAPVLVGWAAGAHVQRARGLEPASLRRTATRSLARVLGVREELVTSHLRGLHWHDWQRDPFSQGGYSWVRAGGVDAHASLAEPLSRTLYFAGEATRGDGLNATMDGAIESGWRAAEELLSAV